MNLANLPKRFEIKETIPSREKIKIGVYGTLKYGHGNHRYYLNRKPVGEIVVPNLDLYSLGGFPGVRPGNGKVKMEVYEVNPNELKKIDGLEGIPFLYRRVYDKELDLYFYLYNSDRVGEKIDEW